MFQFNEESSQACYDDLAQHQLLKHYQQWEPKRDGIMEGLKLFGKRKDNTDKTVYVKKYQPYLGMAFYELDDFLAFSIMRSCGIAAPKVKIKSAGEFNYLFSTDITQRQLNGIDPHPEFVPLEKICVRNTLYIRHAFTSTLVATDAQHHEMISLNPVNIAKFLLACLLLRLNDLRTSNTGVLIERHDNRSTAQIALIDFSINYHHPSLPDTSRHQSLATLVSSETALRVFLRLSNLVTLDEDDFMQAYLELETTFIAACEQAEQQAKKFDFESKSNIDHAEKIMQHWKANFYSLQEFVRGITHDNSNHSLNRASITS